MPAVCMAMGDFGGCTPCTGRHGPTGLCVLRRAVGVVPNCMLAMGVSERGVGSAAFLAEGPMPVGCGTERAERGGGPK